MSFVADHVACRSFSTRMARAADAAKLTRVRKSANEIEAHTAWCVKAQRIESAQFIHRTIVTSTHASRPERPSELATPSRCVRTRGARRRVQWPQADRTYDGRRRGYRRRCERPSRGAHLVQCAGDFGFKMSAMPRRADAIWRTVRARELRRYAAHGQ